MSQEAVFENDGGGKAEHSGAKEVDTEANPQTQRTKIEVRAKKGLLTSAIPHVKVPMAWIVLFFNVFIPGSGTLILSLNALCGVPTDLKQQNRCLAFAINLFSALLQVVTAIVIVGWVLSVYWGMFAVTEANKRKDDEKAKKKLENAEETQKLRAEDNKDADNAVNKE